MGFQKEMIESLTQIIKVKVPDAYEVEDGFIIRPLKYSENVTFLIEEPSKKRKEVLRINRPDYHNLDELMGEIQWMQELKEQTDLILPDVYAGKNGEYIQEFEVGHETYTAIMISFLEGRLVGELSGEELNHQMFQIGKILAKMHIQSQNRSRNITINRFSWGIEDVFGPNANWGNWRNFDNFYKLTKQQYSILEETEKRIIQKLTLFGTTPNHYGLIHADMHCSNIIVKDGVSQIFDFDDCGYGYYLYDFGCSLVEYDTPQLLLQFMVEGYETVKKLTQEEKNLLNMFVLLRRMVRMAWIAGHSDNDTVQTIHDIYYQETFRMAQAWCIND